MFLLAEMAGDARHFISKHVGWTLKEKVPGIPA